MTNLSREIVRFSSDEIDFSRVREEFKLFVIGSITRATY